MPPTSSVTPGTGEPMVYAPKDYEAEFDGSAYLDHFYSKDAMEQGTRLSLFALPTFAALLRKACPPEQRRSLLDVGAGPTVYSAVCFRDVCQEAWLADFLQQNLDHLQDWLHRRRAFDWLPVIRVIARCEGLGFSPNLWSDMEEQARALVGRGAIVRADVHEPSVLLDGSTRTFDVLVSVFCLESACTELDEYRRAFRHMVGLLRPGGHLILGSVLEDDCYTAGVRAGGQVTFFTLLPLSEQVILDTLTECDCECVQKLAVPQEGVMFLMARKRTAAS